MAETGRIQWRSGPQDVVPQNAAELGTTLAALNQRGAARHVVVQCSGPVTDAERSALGAAGLHLLSYLGDDAFIAVAEPRGVDAARSVAVGKLVAVLPLDRDRKLHADLLDGVPIEWAVVGERQGPKQADGSVRTRDDPVMGMYVLFHSDVNLDGEGQAAVWRHGGWVRSRLRSINGLVVELPLSAVKPLAAEDAVLWIEPPLPKLSPTNDSNRARTGASVVQAAPYGLDGTGVTVLLYDAGTAYAAHPDFGGRVHVRDASGEHYHPTHVAGTIGGSGMQSSGLYRGMAPGVSIESYGIEQPGGLHAGFLYTDPGDLEADYHQAIGTYGADLSNNSIGTNTAPNGFPCDWEGDYGVTDALIDAIVRGDGSNPLFSTPFRIVWANGNERGSGRCGSTYHTTAPPACAKNHITVGALNSDDDSVTTFTSWGPSDDGRLKPDISAPGCQSSADFGVTSCNTGGGYQVRCGTSMASPTVCGLGALLLQDYRAQHPEAPDFRNSTLKVLLAHAALDLGPAGPDYQTGYGSVRIQPAIDLMRSGNVLEDSVTQGERFSVLIVVDPGDSELKATLAWDDVPGTPLVVPALVNDLDLRVLDGSNNVYYPWTLGGVANPSAPAERTLPDHVNNIEQVVIDHPQPGLYRVEVCAYNVPAGPQPFSLTGTPALAACSAQGYIAFDRQQYLCESTATLQVADCDLNTADDIAETLAVTVASPSEPAGETVVLTETGPAAATFEGTLPLSTTDGPGVLLVANGATLTATYVDADNGQRQQAVAVTAAATVDCLPPTISDVQADSVQPRSAVLSFGTSEAANGTVFYGLTCAALEFTRAESGYPTAHAFSLDDLVDNTTYFYVVEARDEAGNSTIADNGGLCYSFTTPDIPDFFTEEFGFDNDLSHVKLSFTPNGSSDFYSGCAETITALPTDPAGGLPLIFSPSMDDGYATVNLSGGARVGLYGASYGTLFPGSNGYITFLAGDSDFTEALADHFARPRVAALFDDLNPAVGGSVTWRQLADRVAVTWFNVPELGSTTQNTFQIELHFNGTITISYLGIGAADGIAGLSAGTGLPANLYDTNLSGMAGCGPQPPSAYHTSADTAVGVPLTVPLSAGDDGLPDPPAALTYVVTGLPVQGDLFEPGHGQISSAPHALANGENRVEYHPAPDYRGTDILQFRVNDGGTPPEGGDSNLAAVTVTVGGPAWDPVAYDVNQATAVSVATDVTLAASDPNGDPLAYVIRSLPTSGWLSDLGAGLITAVPYTLVDGGKIVTYQPPCGSNLVATFAFSACDATAASNTANVTITVTDGLRVVRSFPMDSDPGWVAQGQWAFGHPTGQGGTAHGNPDPTNGATGSHVFGVNLNGDYATAVGGPYYLTTEALDLTRCAGVTLRFKRWLNTDFRPYVRAGLEASDNGSSWTTVWSNGSSAITDSAWSPVVYDLSPVADHQSTVYIRWSYQTGSGAWAYSGWNIDDVEVWGLVPAVPGDFTGDGALDLADFLILQDCLAGPEVGKTVDCMCVDLDQDGDVDLAEFAALQAAFTGG